MGQAESDRAFFGHPKGLGYLAVAEGLSSFANFGMLSLLVLYLRGALLESQAGSIWGYATFHRLLESAYGPLGAQGTAAAITGLYGASIYATPMLGGFLADRWIGRRPAVILGAVLMTAGYFLMTVQVGFLPALAAIAFGMGCFSANIRVQIAELYATDDERRGSAFQIYTLVSLIGVIAAPLMIGTLGEKQGFIWGFTAAGLGAALGLLSYLAGFRHLPRPIRPSASAASGARLDRNERRIVLLLILLVPMFALSQVGNAQIFNAYLLWGKDHYDLAFRGETMPVSWLLSADSLIGIGAISGTILFWRWWAARRPEPDDVIKIALGAMFAGLAPLSLAIGSWVMGDAKLGLAWGLGFHVLNAIGYANLFPIGLALYSRISPASVSATMTSVFYLGIFGASLLGSRLGAFLETMTSVGFWLMHAAVIMLGGGLMLVAARLSGSLLTPRRGAEAPVAEVPVSTTI